MTAAEILEQLLDGLGDLKCPHGHIDFDEHHGCKYCFVLEQVVQLYMQAENERERARLIFREAA